MRDRREIAETLALGALTWLAGQPELWERYLAATGAAAEAVAARAADPELLAAVLDFLLTEDAMVLEFARASGMRPEEVLAARRALPGGEALEW